MKARMGLCLLSEIPTPRPGDPKDALQPIEFANRNRFCRLWLLMEFNPASAFVVPTK